MNIVVVNSGDKWTLFYTRLPFEIHWFRPVWCHDVFRPKFQTLQGYIFSRIACPTIDKLCSLYSLVSRKSCEWIIRPVKVSIPGKVGLLGTLNITVATMTYVKVSWFIMVAFQVLCCDSEIARIFVVSDVTDNSVPFNESF